MSFRPRPWLLLVLLLCVLVLGELLLRIFGFGNPVLVEPNQFTNYELLPDQSIRRLWPISDSWVAHVRTNHHGMRSDEISDTKDPRALRIYFLGDSYTYGTTQIDQEETFTALLQHDLPQIVRQPVEVMNGSISGWAISNELAYLQEHGTLGANHVILVLNAGDPGQPKAVLPDNYAIPSTLHHPRSAYEELLFRALIPQFYRLQRSLGVHIIAVARLAEDPGLHASNDNAVIEENIRYLTQMKFYVESRGAAFSIIFIGKAGDYDTPLKRAATESGKEAIAGWSRQNQVPFVDIETALGEHAPVPVLLRDHEHPNVAGARRIATEIEQNWAKLTRNSGTGVRP